jgi:2-polyprenyl-6-methoxyphenol hydroxylase-like FAD-dependent oxidoreductase
MQAVIGAGAAGLVTARELLREGHSVVVYEQACVILSLSFTAWDPLDGNCRGMQMI